MATPMELYIQFCDAGVNDTHTYSMHDVSDLRRERAEQYEEIGNYNREIADNKTPEEVETLRQHRDSEIESLEKMDKVLAMADNENSGYLILKRINRAAWEEMEPIVYINDSYEATDAVTFFNAHAIITDQPKEPA